MSIFFSLLAASSLEVTLDGGTEPWMYGQVTPIMSNILALSGLPASQAGTDQIYRTAEISEHLLNSLSEMKTMVQFGTTEGNVYSRAAVFQLCQHLILSLSAMQLVNAIFHLINFCFRHTVS